jgi:hypothetical protein
MCELLALSANTPTDMTFSFRGLAQGLLEVCPSKSFPGVAPTVL